MTRLPRVPLLLVVVLALVTACSSSSGGTNATTTAPVATSTALALTPAGKTYGVGRRDITLVDHSRDTAGDAKDHIAPKKGRTLKTVILYPTTDRSDDASSDDDPVAPGRYPLVVFSHGVTASGPAYVGVIKKVAAKGYVVALPTFPLTSGPDGWHNLIDVQNQPADVSFTIGQMLHRSAASSGLLAGHLDPDAVAVAGHSLGAITSLLFYNSCCVDRRVRAVVSLSGVLFPAKKSSDTVEDPPRVPLLLLHGEADKTVPYKSSTHIFDTFTHVPRALVSFPDVGHVQILGQKSLIPAIVAFLDMELRDAPAEWRHLGTKVAHNGDATIAVAGGLPKPD